MGEVCHAPSPTVRNSSYMVWSNKKQVNNLNHLQDLALSQSGNGKPQDFTVNVTTLHAAANFPSPKALFFCLNRQLNCKK